MSQSYIWRKLNNILPSPLCQTNDTGDINEDYKWLKGQDSNGTPRWQDARKLPSLAQVKAASANYTKSQEEQDIDELRVKLKGDDALTDAEVRKILKSML